jgi:ethylbenzene dioxygenase beta subunit
MNTVIEALPPTLADAQTQRRIEQFLYREARLLDTERLDEWLALMAEDIHYWMPNQENRRRADKTGAYQIDGGAFFNDNLLDLTRRVTRFKQPSAWAEDPATRHAHVVRPSSRASTSSIQPSSTTAAGSSGTTTCWSAAAKT